jgi:hypothetical protein
MCNKPNFFICQGLAPLGMKDPRTETKLNTPDRGVRYASNQKFEVLRRNDKPRNEQVCGLDGGTKSYSNKSGARQR